MAEKPQDAHQEPLCEQACPWGPLDYPPRCARRAGHKGWHWAPNGDVWENSNG